MRLLIIGFLVIALGVAGVATYLIRTYVKPPAEEVVATKSIKVLIAKRDIRRGDTLGSGNLAWIDWPEASLHEKYIAVESENQEKKRMDDFTGSIARQPFATGEPILADKTFKIKRSALMAGMLDPGMRAVALTVAADTSVSGFIYPGDRVDVMLTHDKVRKAIDKTEDAVAQDEEPNVASGGSAQELIVLLFTTETILRDILVLAIDQAVENPEGKPLPSKTVTLAVTQKQAEILATARAMGRLSMSLRSLASPFDREDTELTSTTDVEVSPMMRNINELLANQEQMRLQAAKAEMEAEKLQMEEQARAARKSERLKEKEYKKAIRDLKKENRSLAKKMDAQEKARKADALKKKKETVKKPPVAVKKSEEKPKAPPPEPKSVIKIFRGKAAETEELTAVEVKTPSDTDALSGMVGVR